MDKIEHSAEIDGKQVNVIIIYDHYKEKHYKKDFQHFVEYQNKSTFTGEAGEAYFKLYQRVKNMQFIQFDVFKKTNATLFSKSIFFMLKNNPNIILSEKLNIEIKLISGRFGYVTYHSDLSDNETACFDMEGVWFIETIVAPFVYLNKIDYSYIAKFFCMN